ncbi:MAG: TonB-dependent receptor plug domain-containing protein, partial [Ginsengibacter sp.]
MLGVFVLSTQMFAQNRTIAGKVSDATGQPIAGASVLVKGTRTGTTTSQDGTFSLNVPAKAKTLTISSINMATQDVAISGGDMTISLAPKANNLEEVVVTGYQTIKKVEFTGASTNVAGTEIAQKPVASFLQLLQGKAPGVQVTGTSGRPGANAIIRVRGQGSINASSEPLIIVDGVPVSAVAYNELSANDVENITVLKDASASAIYGSRAANGVLVVTTKRGS